MTLMRVQCDYQPDALTRCAVDFASRVTLPDEADTEVNRLAAIINLAAADGWQALNTRHPEAALTYCPAHRRIDAHVPCCSIHQQALTCEEYRRTHFVQVRPCCGNDKIAGLNDAMEARARTLAVEPGDVLTTVFPREANTIWSTDAAVGLVGQTSTLRLPDGVTVRPVEVIDAEVVEGNLMVTIEIGPGPPIEGFSFAPGGVSLGYWTEPDRPKPPEVLGKVTCRECEREIATYRRGPTTLVRNHNNRGGQRCTGSKRVP